MGSRILYRTLGRTTSSTSFAPPLIPIGCDPVKTFLRLPFYDFQASAQYPRCRLGVGTNCAPANHHSGQSTQTPSTTSTNLQRRNFVVWLLEHFPTWAASALYPPSFKGIICGHTITNRCDQSEGWAKGCTPPNGPLAPGMNGKSHAINQSSCLSPRRSARASD